MIVINSSTRQFNIPGADMTFGVEADAGSERKYFQCPRYVGNKLDIASSFVRINYRNANGEVDSYLVEDLEIDGDNVTFSWELYPKVTAYKGQIRFVMCVVGPDTKVAWHTTLGTGVVLEGLEPDYAVIQAGTADVVAQLIALVDKQTAAVENKGVEWVRNVQSEGTDQVIAVQTAAQEAQAASVAEIEAKGVNTRESIPEDYTALSEAVDTLNRTRGAAIVCEASGETVVVKDASDLPMQGLRIFGRSTQDGTPTPDAPVEIKSVVEPVVTVCGKNLFKTEFEPGYTEMVRGVTFTVNPDRSIHVMGTPTAAIAYNIFEDEVFPIGSYFLSGAPTAASQKFRLQVNLSVNGTEKTGGVDMGEGSKLSVDASVSSLRGYIYVASDAGEVDGVFYPQLEFGSVANDYKPYSGQTVNLTHTLPGIPVTSGGNYTDSEGQQWICDEVDLERGVYVQRVGKIVFTGTEGGWYLNGSAANGDTRLFQLPYLSYSGTKEKLPKAFCTHVGRAENTFESDNTSFCVYNTGGKSYVRLRHNAADLDEFKSFLVAQHTAETPVTIYYDAGETIETTLSETEIAAYRALHSNYPNTTVLNDSGAHMVVKYAADTKLYIDNKIAALVGG